jgi:hypothetical protein
MTGPTCSITGCRSPVLARGYCGAHYRRWQRHGDPRAALPIRRAAKGGTSFAAVRRRLIAVRGTAPDHRCDCGAWAAAWAYDGGDRNQLTEPRRGRVYSLDMARYRPRCASCHRRAVTAPSGAQLDVERVVWLYQRGASGPGIASFLGVSRSTVYRALHARLVPLRRRGRHSSSCRAGTTNRATPKIVTEPQSPDDD